MLDHRAEFFPELLVAVIDAIQVSTCSGHALHDPTRLFDVLIAHLVQRELRRVEGHSVRAVDGRSRPECDQSFVSAREFRVAEHPIERVGVLLQDRVRHLVQEVGNETEVLLELVEDLLPGHRTPPFSRFPRRVDSNKYSILRIGVAVYSPFLQEGLWARERHSGLSLFTGMPRAGLLGNRHDLRPTPPRSLRLPPTLAKRVTCGHSRRVRCRCAGEAREGKEEVVMPTYVSLINWTDQGIRTVGETLDRADKFGELAQKHGARLG